LQVTMRNVQENLDEDEAAIEFVSFKLFDKKTTDSIIYAAYLFNKRDSSATFIPLFEERQLQKLLDSGGKSATGIAHNFYRGIEVRDRSNLQLGTNLYNILWKPLEKYLKGITKVSYAPSGKLYGIAFQALRVDSNHLLMDKYQLQQYTSTRQIAMRNKEGPLVQAKDIVLFGNADFTMDSLELSGMQKGKSDASTPNVVTRGGGGGTGVWPDLPGTAEEVRKIATLYDKNKISSKQFVEKDASEENLKSLSGNSPQTIHIATHGFFIPAKTSSDDKGTYHPADDPLLRSGLILSGGNYAWSGKTPVPGVEDGIVTAYEISQMNLSNTQLVVLSACETALGDIKGTEGVYGLQRAFKMAGVDKMIVSLWQVPDVETAELMTAFYGYWIGGKKIEDAFTQAQADMRKKYDPFYWAAFVLIQ
jgi:CHAT domain-containing protein